MKCYLCLWGGRVRRDGVVVHLVYIIINVCRLKLDKNLPGALVAAHPIVVYKKTKETKHT